MDSPTPIPQSNTLAPHTVLLGVASPRTRRVAPVLRRLRPSATSVPPASSYPTET